MPSPQFGEDENTLLVDVPNRFPNLKRFVSVLYYSEGQHWSSLIAAHLIENNLNNFTGRGPYEFVLKLCVDNKEDIIEHIHKPYQSMSTLSM